MKLGVAFPHDVVRDDTAALREFLDAVVAGGFQYVVVSDHVIAADPSVHTDWPGPYDLTRATLEPAVVLGFLAAWSELELATGIMVLPTRSAALVAKQAATLDRLTEGRFRLGVGLGWSAVEFEAMGAAWADRGARAEEQIEVMRRLWSEQSVTFEGRFHQLHGAGLNPRPRASVPVWVATTDARPALERAGRVGDGWMPAIAPGPDLERAQEIVFAAARAVGRDPVHIGMEGTVSVAADTDQAIDDLERWRAAGATHVAFGFDAPSLSERLARLDSLSRALTNWS